MSACDKKFPVALEYLALVVVGPAVQSLSCPIPMFPPISIVVVDVPVLVGFVDVEGVMVIVSS